jgi:molybdopterin synthase sulfur carrier subunit
VLYFASLRDAAGMDSERVDRPESLLALYDSLRLRHGFALARERLRVAVNGEFARWDDAVADGAEIAFIPPVSGG